MDEDGKVCRWPIRSGSEGRNVFKIKAKYK